MNSRRIRIRQAWMAVCVLAFLPLAHAEQFTFVALGDTTYEVPADDPVYRSLISTINEANPRFSIHVGDTKGWGDCGDEFQLAQKKLFDTYTSPVVYAFGNNEWSECWRENRNSGDPVKILNSMRGIFFGKPESLGAVPMPLVRQSDVSEFRDHAENVRWNTGEVTFATLNVVGDHNNQLVRDEHLWREFFEREKANVAWIAATFASATAEGHKAVVIAMHSDIFVELGRLEDGPFFPLLQAITKGAEKFAGQVLVVHGHEHAFTVDRPLYTWDEDATTLTGENLTRLQVFGWPDMKAVRVSVDTEKPWIFGFEPLYAKSSLSPAFTD